MNINFKNVWILIKHKDSVQGFGVVPYAFECEFLGVVFIESFSIGPTCMKIAFVLLVFIQKGHLTFALWSGILESSLVDQVIRNVQCS